MAREKELFRDNLVLLREKFGRMYYVPIVGLASWLS